MFSEAKVSQQRNIVILYCKIACHAMPMMVGGTVLIGRKCDTLWYVLVHTPRGNQWEHTILVVGAARKCENIKRQLAKI